MGVRISKWKDLSGRTVTRAGMGIPGVMWAVRALNSYAIYQLLLFALQLKIWWELEWLERSRVDKYLAEIHTLHTFTSQCRTNRRTGTRLPSTHNQLDDLICCGACFRHSLLLCCAIELVPEARGRNSPSKKFRRQIPVAQESVTCKGFIKLKLSNPILFHSLTIRYNISRYHVKFSVHRTSTAALESPASRKTSPYLSLA